MSLLADYTDLFDGEALAAWIACFVFILFGLNQLYSLVGKTGAGRSRTDVATAADIARLEGEMATEGDLEKVKADVEERIDGYSSAHYRSRQVLHEKVNEMGREISHLKGMMEGVAKQVGACVPPPPPRPPKGTGSDD